MWLAYEACFALWMQMLMSAEDIRAILMLPAPTLWDPSSADASLDSMAMATNVTVNTVCV